MYEKHPYHAMIMSLPENCREYFYEKSLKWSERKVKQRFQEILKSGEIYTSRFSLYEEYKDQIDVKYHSELRKLDNKAYGRLGVGRRLVMPRIRRMIEGTYTILDESYKEYKRRTRWNMLSR